MSAYHAETIQETTRSGKMSPPSCLSPDVVLALTGIRESAKEGLLALCVQVGLETMGVLFEQELDEKVGPKGKHNPERKASRHGYDDGEVVLGGRKVSIRRPRARTAANEEIQLETYRHFQNDDQLVQAAFERMLHGLSTRRYEHGLEDIGSSCDGHGTSKSAISSRFIQMTKQSLQKLLEKPLDKHDLVAIYMDGIVVAEYTILAALGVDMQGHKHLLGLWEGASENKTVCRELLSNLVERGLDCSQGLLFVIDGSKALRRAIADAFGNKALVQRCQVHKLRNVLEHLPKEEQAFIKRKLINAWAEPDANKAEAGLLTLAKSLEDKHPGAAASLREGLEETLTINRLQISSLLRRVLRSTNPIESANEIVKTTARRVKRWRSGTQALRWAAAGFLEAEKRFRRIKGYRELPMLRASLSSMTSMQTSAEGLSA